MNEDFAKLGIDLDVSMHLRLLVLVMARVTGLAMPLPFFGGKLLPARIRFGVPLFLALFFYPFLYPTVPPSLVPDVGLLYFGLLLKEVFIGYCIGFLVSLPFFGLEAGGAFIDTQRGTTFAQVISPLTGGQASLVGQFMNLLFIAIFLSIGGLEITLGGLAHSYSVFPLLSVPKLMHPTAPAALFFIDQTAHVFTIAVQFAAPVVICMFITDMTLGTVNRAAPNIQVFFLGMPLKALGGLVVVLILLDFLHEFLAKMMVDLAVAIRELLRAMAAT